MTLRQAWDHLVATGRLGAAQAGLSPLDLPYHHGGGDSSDPYWVDLDEERAVVFPHSAVSSLEEWVRGFLEVRRRGQLGDVELLNALLRAAAHVVGGETEGAGGFHEVVDRRWRAVVAVPIGGAFLVDGPVVIGDRLLVGHLDRVTEQRVESFAVRWDARLEGFRFPDEVWWAEEYVAAEQDGSVARAIEQQLVQDEGWMPLIVAFAVDGAGYPAHLVAIEAAQALIGALYVLGSEADSHRPRAPWILDLEGDSSPYGVRPRELPSVSVDGYSGVPGVARPSGLYLSGDPVDVQSVLEHGHASVLERVALGALDREDLTALAVARACQLITAAASTSVDFAARVLENCAALLLNPGRAERPLSLFPEHETVGSSVDGVEAVRDALVDLASNGLE